MATSRGSTKGKTTKWTATGQRNRRTQKDRSNAGRKYSPVASKYVEEEMKEMKQGKLKSGRSGQDGSQPEAGNGRRPSEAQQ